MKLLEQMFLIIGASLFALANTVAAKTQGFPRERTAARSCADVAWIEKMSRSHPTQITACKDVIDVNGKSWAGFAARLLRVDR
jgi:hypothetical protein